MASRSPDGLCEALLRLTDLSINSSEILVRKAINPEEVGLLSLSVHKGFLKPLDVILLRFLRQGFIGLNESNVSQE